MPLKNQNLSLPAQASIAREGKDSDSGSARVHTGVNRHCGARCRLTVELEYRTRTDEDARFGAWSNADFACASAACFDDACDERALGPARIEIGTCRGRCCRGGAAVFPNSAFPNSAFYLH